MGDPEGPDESGSTSHDPQLFHTTQRADEVQAWAQRLRDKRANRQAATEPPKVSAHWSTEALFEQSRHVAEEERLSGTTDDHRAQLLASLGLDPLASPAAVTRAFRELAKLHHPDRYVNAPAEVQAQHAEAMARINATYQALKAAPDRSLPKRPQ